MKPKSFLMLTGVTAAAVLAAVVTTSLSEVGGAISERGQAFLPELVGNASRVAAVTVDVGDRKTVVTRKGDVFVDGSGFPVRSGVVQDLVNNIALLTIWEKKTADASRLGDLKLEAPAVGEAAGKASEQPATKPGAGQRVILKDASGGTIADIIVGERDYTVGGTRGGQYVRQTSAPQAFLARGAVIVPDVRSAWFDTGLITIKADDVDAIEGAGKDGTTFMLSRNGDKLGLPNIPEGRQQNDERVSRIPQIFSSLSFSDVRASDAKVTPAGRKLTARTKDGLVVTVTAFAPDNADAKLAGDFSKDEAASWVRVVIDASKVENAEIKKLAETAAPRVAGFDFLLSAGDIEALHRTTDELLAEPKS